MTIGGTLGAISLNPFVLLHGFFLAVLGICVVGGEFSWEIVLDRAPFLSSYAGKGFFFLYIALPLVEDGWAEYKNCVLWWSDLPCPTTPADVDPPGNWLASLLTQSVLVQFGVGLALAVAGVLKLLFAATGPPLRDGTLADGTDDDNHPPPPTLQSRRGSEAIEPLLQSRDQRSHHADVDEPALGVALPNNVSIDTSLAVGQDATDPTTVKEQATATTIAAASAQLEVERLKAELASMRRSQQATVEASATDATPANARGTTYAEQQRQALLANLRSQG